MRTANIFCAAFFAALLVWGCSQREHRVTIIVSNDMEGEIRSCGCTSKDFGGLGRRATYVDAVRRGPGDVLLFEGGDFFGLDLNYGPEKAALTLQSMSVMDYDGIVPGETDFAFGVDYLIERTRAQRLPLVAANLHDAASDTLIFAPSRSFETPGGLRVGVIGVLGTRLRMPRGADDRQLRISEPVAALEREIPNLEDVDLVIVLAHMGVGEARRLAGLNPAIDMVVTGHDGRPMRQMKRLGNAFLLTTSPRGRYVATATAVVADGTIQEIATQQEALSTRYNDHEAIVKLFQAYDMEIANIEKQRIASTLPQGENVKRPFAGAEGCADCHEEIYDHWQGTKHAHAFDILVQQSREFDRDCTPCHTTGFYELGGFRSLASTPELIHIQCEACHGNGAEHLANPDIPPAKRAKQTCQGCHNEEQTPDFQFEAYWERIAHPGD